MPLPKVLDGSPAFYACSHPNRNRKHPPGWMNPGSLNSRAYNKKIWSLQEQFGLHVDPAAKIWQLSVGEQQRGRNPQNALSGANILIMDEPTAVLAPQR
jgi:ABC-type uncharacterized transport system ATPase subunit